MALQCVIWDWNGTLADDLEASLLATNDILAKRNMPPITLEQYYSYIDSPISRFYAHLFDLSEVPMSVIGVEFAAFYQDHFSGLQTGALELLEALQQKQIRQVILSSAHRESILRDAGRLGILPYFDAILAADNLLAEGKVERGKQWLSGQSIPTGNIVMIGDTLHDLETAEAMGISCILCAFGHQSEADLRHSGATVVRDMPELRQLLLG